jgi:ATP-dependent 26S proteasome regulatory subunit
MKNQIKSLIENFLSSKDFYVDNKIPWKRGILLFGPPGNGKSSIIRTIISSYNFKPITVVSEANNEQIRESFKYAEKSSPSLLYFEDLDSLLESRIDTSTFLNLMDGISTQNGIFIIATANDISKLKTNIINRPSRFDRKFEIPLPTSSMADIYLSRWFGDIITEKKRKELAVYAENNKFSYAYLKELYISSMFEAISNNRKKPTTKDIDKALSCIVKDKNILKNSIDISKYTK